MTQSEGLGFFDRIRRQWPTSWVKFGQRARVEEVHPDLPDQDVESVRLHMQECLEGRGGEVSARNRAAVLGRVYCQLTKKGRERFLRILADDFETPHDMVDAAVVELADAADDPIRRPIAEKKLRTVLEAPRLRLLMQFNSLPDGIKFLVDMRSDLLPLVRRDPSLARLEDDLKNLLAAWFDIGFLELRRITWRSPALVLEKLISYEAVHAIRSWTDMKNRLDSDRRLYAFFHPRMPDEPLIFVEVALVKGIADNVQALLDEKAPVGNPEEADAAIFYSISNAQRGLAGISFGNFLIKRVVSDLSAEFKALKIFSTLSPIPGFLAWLHETLAEGQAGLLTPAERKPLLALADSVGAKGAKGTLKALLEKDDWYKDEKIAAALREPVMRLCAHYLVQEKKKNRARDPVTHFHLSNGARIERINWLGDTSPNGLKQSAGMMVNYLYKLDEIEDNHEAYSDQGKIAASAVVRKMAKRLGDKKS